MKPRFKHDCLNCKFLGFYQNHDLYYCNNVVPTVIARYGDNGPSYLSGMVFGISDVQNGDYDTPLAQAYMRAKALDLKVSMWF
jgi:hypothetical protein